MLLFYLLMYYKTPISLDVHCGVVGNIQAFHVCAPGSIPGDGVFYFIIYIEEDILYRRQRQSC